MIAAWLPPRCCSFRSCHRSRARSSTRGGANCCRLGARNQSLRALGRGPLCWGEPTEPLVNQHPKILLFKLVKTNEPLAFPHTVLAAILAAILILAAIRALFFWIPRKLDTPSVSRKLDTLLGSMRTLWLLPLGTLRRETLSESVSGHSLRVSRAARSANPATPTHDIPGYVTRGKYC